MKTNAVNIAAPAGCSVFQFRVHTGTETNQNRVIDASAPETPKGYHAREFADIYCPPNIGQMRDLLLIGGFFGDNSFRRAIDWSTAISDPVLERTTPWDLLALSAAYPRLDFDIGFQGEKMYVASTRDCPYIDGKPCTTRVWYRKHPRKAGASTISCSARCISLPYTEIIVEPFAWFLFAIRAPL